jgi:hypothetical protein
MALETRLKRRVEAGLLDDPQVQQIIEFEKGHERSLFLYAIAGLGSFAVAIGIVSIIAANWDSIPGRVKAVLHPRSSRSGAQSCDRYPEPLDRIGHFTQLSPRHQGTLLARALLARCPCVTRRREIVLGYREFRRKTR